MAPSVAARLKELTDLKDRYDGASAAGKLASIAALAGGRFGTPAALTRFHECLCFLRAYPDDARVLGAVEEALAGFAARPDLRLHRAALVDSGIAGTDIRFAFFAPTANWLARRFPGNLRVDWGAFEHKDRLDRMLELLVRWSETPALDEGERSVRAWIETLKGPRETDGAFLVRRLDALNADAFVRQRVFEELDPPFVLSHGPDTPSRTPARHRGSPVVLQPGALRRDRPDLARQVAMPPRAIRAVSGAEAPALIDLAREAMVTRSRDLDAFMFGDPRDVRLVDCGGGPQLAGTGAPPERRRPPQAVYRVPPPAERVPHRP